MIKPAKKRAVKKAVIQSVQTDQFENVLRDYKDLQILKSLGPVTFSMTITDEIWGLLSKLKPGDKLKITGGKKKMTLYFLG